MNTNLLFKRLLFLWVFVLSSSVWGQYNGTGTFTKITSVAEVTDGYYVIANSADTFAMNSANAGKFFTHTAIAPLVDNITNPAADIVWKIEGNAAGRTIFNEMTATYVSYAGTKNEAYASSSGSSDNQKWTITYTGSNFKVANLAVTTRLLEYNSASPRFACYTSSQQDLQLYKLQEAAGPTISVTPSTVPALTASIGASDTEVIVITGSSLTGNISTAITGTNGDQFSVAPVTLPSTGGNLTVTYTPTILGNHSATLTLSSAGAEDVVLELTGLATLAAPVATAATSITPTSFMANWNAVSGAESYELDVYESTGSATTITETFTEVGGGTTSSYATRTWTGDEGIEWTAYKARTDEKITADDDAITLKNEAGAYLESGIIPNGLTHISFDVQQKFAGTGGILTIKVLSGTDFLLETVIGTYGYTPTASTYNSGEISGITGDYKIVLENNASARAAIDNLSFTSAASKTYNLNAENVGSVTSHPVSGLDPETTYYYVVRAKAGAVTSANSNEIEVTTMAIPQITWTNGAWSNTTGPDATAKAVIASDYSDPAGIDALSLTVNEGVTLTVTSYVNTGDVINNGNIRLADGAKLKQTGTFTAGSNSSFEVNRSSKQVKRLDYIGWSSPMKNSAQTLKQFSYGSGANVSQQGTRDNRFYKYNGGVYVETPATGTFDPAGQGFLIRTPNDFTTNEPGESFNGRFTGTEPNTGTITYDASAITGQYVFLGNPYPSALDKEGFFVANPEITGTFYTWNSTAKMIDNEYSGSNYVTYTQAGSVPAGTNDGYVAVGQGFFVDRGENTINSFVFNDAMRSANQTGIFAKAPVTDKFWLQLTTPSNSTPQMLIGFSSSATAGYDAGLDGKMMDSNADVIYSTVDGKNLVIDVNAALDANSTVKVNARFLSAGTYRLGLAAKEGVFAGAQKIFVKDQLTGAVTDLSAGDYTFTAEPGLQPERFTLYFSDRFLGTVNNATAEAVIYAANQTVHVKAPAKITSVEVYDMSGKLMKKVTDVRGRTLELPVAQKGIAVVKLQLAGGEIVTKKVLIK